MPYVLTCGIFFNIVLQISKNIPFPAHLSKENRQKIREKKFMYYIFMQILTIIESASLLIFLWVCLGVHSSEFVFENRNRLMAFFAAATVIPAIIILISSMITGGTSALFFYGAKLALFIIVATAIIFSFIAVGIIYTRKNKIKKRDTKIVTIPARQLKVYTMLQPLLYLQTREYKEGQLVEWTHNGKQETLFVGGILSGLTKRSVLLMELSPHFEMPNTYNVFRMRLLSGRSFFSCVFDILSVFAGIFFVFSLLIMNYDALINHIYAPYPGEYQPNMLMWASVMAMLYKYVLTGNGDAKSVTGKICLRLFKAFALVFFAALFIYTYNTFSSCMVRYFGLPLPKITLFPLLQAG